MVAIETPLEFVATLVEDVVVVEDEEGGYSPQRGNEIVQSHFR